MSIKTTWVAPFQFVQLRQGTCAGKTYSFSDLPALVEPSVSDGCVFEEVATFPSPTRFGVASATFEEEPFWGDPFISCGSEPPLSTAIFNFANCSATLCSLWSFIELTLVDILEGATLLLPDVVLSSMRPSGSP